MANIKGAESILELDNLIVENISFSRGENAVEKQLDININNEIIDLDNNKYKVSLICNVSQKESNFSIDIKVAGWFSINGQIDGIDSQDLIKKNSIAILFPYLRSQITLVTSQPNLTPIILPPININTLLNEQNNQGSDN